MLLRTAETLERYGERWGRRLARTHAFLALVGELGSGKTTFLRGFARGLGIRKRLTSPTFILARRYRIPVGKQRTPRPSQRVKRRSGHLPFAISDRPRYFWHIDAYRLSAEKDLLSINFPEILKDRESIVAIEWADRVRSAIPKEAIWFSFRHHKEGRLVMVRKRTPRRTSPQGGSRGNATR